MSSDNLSLALPILVYELAIPVIMLIAIINFKRKNLLYAGKEKS